MSSDTFAIQTIGITRKYGRLTAVDHIDLEINNGELFSLLGPNGAGKTTLISMMCCLLKPSRGTAFIMGHDIVREAFKVKGLIGVCPQEIALSEHLNCKENLSLIGRLHGVSSAQVQKQSQRLLEAVGLMGREKEQVRKFSGGMRRKLSLIMALIHDPEVLFLDEPTLGLDPESRRFIWTYIAGLKGRKTIVLTTHYLEEADALSDTVAIIDKGKIVTLGTPEKLKSSVYDEETLLISARGIVPEVIDKLRNHYPLIKWEGDQLRISASNLDFKSITDWLHSEGVDIYSATMERATLEDVFIQTTGRKLLT